MLSPDQLKPFLTHEDRYIRYAALHYFASMWSRDPDILPIALDARERLGEAAAPLPFYDYDKLFVSERGLDAVLDVLARTADERARDRFNRVLLAAPLELLAAREAAIRENPGVRPATILDFETRRGLADRPAEALWEQLQDVARRWDATPVDQELGEEPSDALIDALARRDTPDDETIVRMLEAPEAEESWLEILLAQLAGARGISRAVPALVAKLHGDADFLLEACQEALPRIGDPEASRLIRAAFPGADFSFKIYAVDVLGNIKHPDSEEAILALLEAEKDHGIRTSLCNSLCELFSERGIEIVRREIRRGYDRTITRLEDQLLPVLAVLRIDIPEMSRWKKERDKEDRRMVRVFAQMEQQLEGLDADLEAAPEEAPPAPGWWESEEPEAPEPEPGEVTAPIRRTERKVGRNDPCPCGSGKKFKKCCGRGG